MTAKRFFVSPESIQGDQVSITGNLVHQLCHVLRMRQGDQLVLLDDSGWEYAVELGEINKERIMGRVLHRTLATGEPRTKITLYQGVLKGHHLEWVWQKGTEIGIVEFVPMICERCLMSSLDDISTAKTARWKRIIQEAAEQAHRGRIPHLQPPMLFSQACDHTRRGGLNLMLWEEESEETLRHLLYPEQSAEWNLGEKRKSARRPFSIGLLVGPEGGFTREEIELARGYGIRTLTLGKRILRAETAGLVAAALTLHEFGDLG
jgi:16S rRNA (uracil1498-N3)-methyltransferase